MSDIIKTLVEMGFPENRAKYALSKTSSSNVQEVMEWLLAHEEELDNTVLEPTETQEKQEITSEKPTESENVPKSEGDAENTSEASTTAEAKSIKCEDCGKLFKSQLEVEFHAAKSGHSNFSESTEEKKPLTEEEKRAQLEKVENLMKLKRQEREEREKREALEREKNRIKSGKDMLEAKRKIDELEMQKLVEQRRREKQEEKLAKQRVLDQIEQDKLARKVKFGPPGTTAPPAPPINPIPAKVPEKVPQKEYTQTRLQIRLTNGSALTQTFGAKEPLSAVRLYVEINRTDEPGPFSLMTNFPKKLFGPDDYDKPLDMLGLTPSAVVIVTRT